MNVNPVAHASAASGTSSSSSMFGSSDTTQTFLKLLTTELQNQDPTSPMDPTTMVSQIVQLNLLSETMTIGQSVQAIQQYLAGTSTASG